MNKTWLIIQREYSSRVKNKRFLILTFLMPILIVGLIAATTYFSITGVEHRSIAVIDPNDFIKNSLKNTNQINFLVNKIRDTALFVKLRIIEEKANALNAQKKIPNWQIVKYFNVNSFPY